MLRLTIRRHAFFSPATAERLDGSLEGASAWDALRTSGAEPSFGIPETRSDWESQFSQRFLVERGAAIAEIAAREEATAIVSLGVGGACIEYQIHASRRRTVSGAKSERCRLRPAGARLRRATAAGHVRTRAVYDTYWRGLYEVREEGRLGDGAYILLAAPGQET